MHWASVTAYRRVFGLFGGRAPLRVGWTLRVDSPALPPYFTDILSRAAPPSGFIGPCLPSHGEQPPTGPDWVHERLSANGAARFRVGRHQAADQERARLASHHPLIVQDVNKLKARSCLIDGEAVSATRTGCRHSADASSVLAGGGARTSRRVHSTTATAHGR
jgi:hypothetical protein